MFFHPKPHLISTVPLSEFVIFEIRKKRNFLSKIRIKTGLMILFITLKKMIVMHVIFSLKISSVIIYDIVLHKRC